MATWLKVPSAVTVAEEQNSSCGHRCKLFSETLTSLDLFQILGCCCFSLQICSGLTGERSSIAIHLKRSFRPEFHEFSESKIRWSSKTRSLLCRLLCIYIYIHILSPISWNPNPRIIIGNLQPLLFDNSHSWWNNLCQQIIGGGWSWHPALKVYHQFSMLQLVVVRAKKHCQWSQVFEALIHVVFDKKIHFTQNAKIQSIHK